ncbi:hypothetical protein A2U01_0110400, partial [Trifolium medium]|nr:hypothetical protein [Trifolium medium]
LRDVPAEEDTDEISSLSDPWSHIFSEGGERFRGSPGSNNSTIATTTVSNKAGAASGSTSHPPAAPVFGF